MKDLGLSRLFFPSAHVFSKRCCDKCKYVFHFGGNIDMACSHGELGPEAGEDRRYEEPPASSQKHSHTSALKDGFIMFYYPLFAPIMPRKAVGCRMLS
jgi:hypothetical protein